MSTTAYTIAESIRTAIKANYTAKLELANSEDLEQNTTYLLKDGFDVSVGASENTGEMHGRGIASSRDMSIILTKKVYDGDLQNTSRHETEQELFKELIDIGSLLTSDNTVVRLVNSLEVVGDNGINIINADKIKHLTTTLDISIKYVEFY